MERVRSRRRFIRQSGAIAAFTAQSWSRVLGANDRIQMGVIGTGVRGKFVMSVFAKDPRTSVKAVCDVWGNQLDDSKKVAPEAKTYANYRHLLDSEKLDVVQVTTPDHWHAPIAIEAMNRGLDVYVEKPLTLTLDEGPKVMQAARSNRRICQVGTQNHSAEHFLQLKRDYFDTNKLGKVTLIRTWYNGNQYHLRRAPDYLQNKPENLDWKMWLGPAKWREWDPQQYWNWRAYFDYGGGQIGDLFVHLLDLAQMLMGKDIPIRVSANGGIFYYKDGRTAPDTITVSVEYPSDFVITFEASLMASAQGVGMEFFGSEGRLVVDWRAKGRAEFFLPEKGAAPIVANPGGPEATPAHVANFLDCVRTRQAPHSDVAIGNRCTQVVLLAKQAYLEKREIHFDPVREEVV